MTSRDPAIDDGGQISLQGIARSIDFLGSETLPSPELLRQYERIVPGMSESIIRMSRLEHEQQQRLVSEEARLARATAWAATVMAIALNMVLLLAVGSVVFLVNKDQQTPALVTAAIAAIGPVVLTVDRYILRVPLRKKAGARKGKDDEGGVGAVE